MPATTADNEGSLTLSDDDRRLLATWTADCAEHALPLFEASSRSDARPREAIEAARAFASGGRRTSRLRALAMAAYAAAREVDDPAAAAAARAAGVAAATAFMHARISANPEKHALGAAAYAALAAELAAGGDPGFADGELRWAVERASQVVRELLWRLPVRGPGRGRLDELLHKLDSDLRSLTR